MNHTTTSNKQGTAKICPNGFVKFYDTEGNHTGTYFYHPQHHDEIAKDLDIVYSK